MFCLTCYSVKDSTMKTFIIQNVVELIYVADSSINRTFEYHIKNIFVNPSRNVSPDILEMFSEDNFKSYKLDILFLNTVLLMLIGQGKINVCFINSVIIHLLFLLLFLKF